MLGDEADVTVEPESMPRQVTKQVARRWKHFLVAAVTAITTWHLYNLDGTWSTDALAFGIITAGILAYTLVTLYSDLRLE